LELDRLRFWKANHKLLNWLDKAELLLSHLPVKMLNSNTMVPFVWNPNQKTRWQKIKEQWDREKKIRIIDLKSRRVGVSAQTDALAWAMGLAFPLMNMKIVAHLTPSAEELFRVPRDLSMAFPSFPKDDIQSKRIFFRHAGGDSHITLATAGTPSAGRGGTLSFLHLSESAYFPSDDSFTAMISSVSKGEGSAIVIESTANGVEGPGEAFFDYWNDAVAGKNGYIPCFLGWLSDPTCVRAAEEADDAPQGDLEKELMAKPFSANKSQIAWMRRTLADDCRNLEFKFLQDFPHCPEVAYQVSGSPAFARDELAYAQRSVREPLCHGKFVRDDAGRGKFVEDEKGPWNIWKKPFGDNGKADGNSYYIGADAALGDQEGDFAAAVVLCGETGEIAARFTERVAPETLADQLDIAGRWFNMALVNIELTGNLGRWAQIKLRDVFRYPQYRIYHDKRKDDKPRGKSRGISLGFEMSQATRRLIIDATRSMLRMGIRGEPGALVVNDSMFSQQMSVCTIKEWRWDVERGHDDCLVAGMIACLTREQYPPTRLKYAPKVTGEPTMKERLAEMGMNVRPAVDDTLKREMAQMMRASAHRRQLVDMGLAKPGQNTSKKLIQV
jgi:hypothetical protein